MSATLASVIREQVFLVRAAEAEGCGEAVRLTLHLHPQSRPMLVELSPGAARELAAALPRIVGNNQKTAEAGETETPPALAADAGEGEASRLNTSPVDHTGIPAFLRVGTPENQALRHGVKLDHVSPYRESGAVCPALGVGVDGFSVNPSTPSSDYTGGAAADE